MQTFLPLPDYAASAAVLDWRRLGKQRVEVVQLLRALRGVAGWGHHPAARMWRGHEWSLGDYGLAICAEWTRRGYRDSCADLIRCEQVELLDDTGPPRWLGDVAFHLSHCSNLLRKLPSHYRQFWPDTPDDLPYIWPDPRHWIRAKIGTHATQRVCLVRGRCALGEHIAWTDGEQHSRPETGVIDKINADGLVFICRM